MDSEEEWKNQKDISDWNDINLLLPSFEIDTFLPRDITWYNSIGTWLNFLQDLTEQINKRIKQLFVPRLVAGT